MGKRHSFRARIRRFRIWQHTGELPFRRRTESLTPVECSSCGHMVDTPFCPNCGQPYKSGGSFFKGTFDSIPFLNDDAKRTFVHLLFRPGYMIMDYLKGKSSRYMAPMMALIIFYAFYALAASIIAPTIPGNDEGIHLEGVVAVGNGESADSIDFSGPMSALNKIGVLASLDRHPECVDTPAKASLAAIESSLRSQGIFLFLGKLIVYTMAIWMLFGIGRKKRLGFSAAATVSAYMLCQFCFVRLLVLFCTWGREESIGFLIIGIIMAIDFHQLFGFSAAKSVAKVIGVAFTSLLTITLLATVVIIALVIRYGVI